MYTKTNGSSMKESQSSSVWKILEIILLILHLIKLENLVVQLKRQSVEAWQNEKHYSKGNNTSENPIPRQEISNQSTMWSTKGRSSHNICCLCSFLLELSSCCVTYENCCKSSVIFFKSSLRWVDRIKKFQRFWVKELLLYNRIYYNWKFSSEVEKCIMWSSIQVLPNQISKKSFYTFKDTDLWESHAKLHKRPSETPGADWV